MNSFIIAFKQSGGGGGGFSYAKLHSHAGFIDTYRRMEHIADATSFATREAVQQFIARFTGSAGWDSSLTSIQSKKPEP